MCLTQFAEDLLRYQRYIIGFLPPSLLSVSSQHHAIMSDIKVEGSQASVILTALAQVFDGYNDEEKAAQVKKNNGVFELRVKDAAGKEAFWTIDLKKTGTVKKGEAKSLGMKPGVTIILSDETFVDIAEGKLTGQKAFMTGALKTKGNMMLATKLDGVLKSTKGKTKL